MSNSHTIKFGCGCDLCQQPIPFVEFPGIEESERRQAAYAEKRRIVSASNGFPTDRKPIRGGTETL